MRGGGFEWTRHTIQEHVTRITTETGVRATPDELREFITITTRLATEDCFSVLPPGAGKTTMLAVAIEAAEREGRRARVVAPTKKAAEVANQELGVTADSVAALVYAHGWRWNDDGVWTRLSKGDVDPDTGRTYDGPPRAARLAKGERVIVDEAGMLDQDTALALLTITHEAGATVALVGDRAQLPAVGRGGVLDMATHIRGTTYDMTGVGGVVTEVGSGLNGSRKRLLRTLGDPTVTEVVVEHRDRLSRFGFDYIDAALSAQGRRVTVVETGEVEDDLVRDIIDVLTSMCARRYGRRSARSRARKAARVMTEGGA